MRRVLPALALLAAPASLAAQGVTSVPAAGFALVGGVSQYDYSGTGTGLHLAGRLTRPLTRVVVGEVGIGYMHYDSQGGDRVRMLIPELQLQLQLPHDRVSPYLGVGGGVAFSWISDANEFQPTLSGAAGVRVTVTPLVSFLGELRVRGVGSDFEGSAAEWTVGVGFRP
ncbi:MAG TPA: outer membrane beta-barrel protein [Gemmatimonadaceae bacterium]|nr:outer membrane beta-barrel protein [Gemmatimonadaceae bacterium]